MLNNGQSSKVNNPEDKRWLWLDSTGSRYMQVANVCEMRMISSMFHNSQEFDQLKASGDN
jgi:hypothetical protein